MKVEEPLCPRCESRLETGDLRCPVCFHAAPAAVTADRTAVKVQILRCSGCGAAITYDVGARAPRCAFCGSQTRIEVPEDPPERIEFFLPFTVDRQAAESAFQRWLAGLGWFRPSDLKTASTVESLQPLWWVGWVCSASTLVSWAADSDAGARKAKWAPQAGQTEVPIDDIIVSASRGLSSAEVAALAPSYDLSTAQRDVGDHDPSMVIEHFDLLRSSARSHVAGMIDRLVERRLKNGHIPGTRFRNLQTAIVMRRLVTRRFAFPSYVLAYRHRKRLYRVVISGQASACLLGSAPYSVLKILMTVVGGLLGLTLLAAVLIAILI